MHAVVHQPYSKGLLTGFISPKQVPLPPLPQETHLSKMSNEYICRACCSEQFVEKDLYYHQVYSLLGSI